MPKGVRVSGVEKKFNKEIESVQKQMENLQKELERLEKAKAFYQKNQEEIDTLNKVLSAE